MPIMNSSIPELTLPVPPAARLHIDGPDWLKTPAGDARGYIDARGLEELWFHTGTACNLRCWFCLEGSKPGDTRIEMLTLADVEPYLAEAVELGVERFSFTGGEPFIVPEFPAILGAALDLRPCLVLTNGTEPLLNRLAGILDLLEKPHPVKFRISLDWPDAARHDEARGKGNFRRAVDCLRRLREYGFAVSVARQMEADEKSADVDAAFQAIFREAGIEGEVPMVAFPDFLGPGEVADVPAITENCMTQYQTGESRAAFMCAYSRMIVKKNGKLGVYACTLVDDDADYDLGPTLRESLSARTMLRHHRCFSCFKYGASCSEG